MPWSPAAPPDLTPPPLRSARQITVNRSRINDEAMFGLAKEYRMAPTPGNSFYDHEFEILENVWTLDTLSEFPRPVRGAAQDQDRRGAAPLQSRRSAAHAVRALDLGHRHRGRLRAFLFLGQADLATASGAYADHADDRYAGPFLSVCRGDTGGRVYRLEAEFGGRLRLLDEFGKDYMRVARAKGLSEGTIIFKYPLRVAIYPIIAGSAGRSPCWSPDRCWCRW